MCHFRGHLDLHIKVLTVYLMEKLMSRIQRKELNPSCSSFILDREMITHLYQQRGRKMMLRPIQEEYLFSQQHPPEVQQPELRESPPLPRIVSTCSLQPNHDSGSPDTRLALLSIFNEDDESTNSILLSAQYSLAEPTAYLPQAESSLPDNFETVRYSTINNSMNPDSALPSLCIPPNFGEFEMAHIVNSILVT